MLKKTIGFLTSLKFGILLFLIIALYSVIGTILPQGVNTEYYLHQYPTFGNLILLFQMDHVYSSAVFMAIVAVFIINLSGCTMNILPGQIKRMRNGYVPTPGKNGQNLYDSAVASAELKEALQKKRFKIIEVENGYYAAKHKLGNVGSSITHLGIIVIIVGAFIGNLFAMEGKVSLTSGEVAAFHDKGFSIQVDDFYMEFREDGSINQYISELSILENGAKVKEEKIWVNNPLSYKGLDLYQSFYGWRSNLQIKGEAGSVLLEDTITDNQHILYEPENLRVFLYGFFPDFTMDRGGNPASKTQKLINPRFAAVLYAGDTYVDSFIVEPGEEIPYQDIQIAFVEPALFTGIVYRQDRGYLFVFAGAVILVLGLLLSFYYYPKYVYVTTDTILPIAAQNAWGYTYQIKILLEGLKDKKEG